MAVLPDKHSPSSAHACSYNNSHANVTLHMLEVIGLKKNYKNQEHHHTIPGAAGIYSKRRNKT